MCVSNCERRLIAMFVLTRYQSSWWSWGRKVLGYAWGCDCSGSWTGHRCDNGWERRVSPLPELDSRDGKLRWRRSAKSPQRFCTHRGGHGKHYCLPSFSAHPRLPCPRASTTWVDCGTPLTNVNVLRMSIFEIYIIKTKKKMYLFRFPSNFFHSLSF